jgi:DNA-binding CsgD family transcriptional regulator
MLTTPKTFGAALPQALIEPLSAIASQLIAYGMRVQLIPRHGDAIPIHCRTPQPPVDLGACLTAAEMRVARMVAAGSTNREIALGLSISVKTVEAHLTRIYRKTGISSRTLLAYRVAVEEVRSAPDAAAR